MAPESVSVGDTLAFPSNTTYATTELDGTGSAKFDVWTREQNASLGCGQRRRAPCVVVPILGISCDVDAASLPAADRPATASRTRPPLGPRARRPVSSRPASARSSARPSTSRSAAPCGGRRPTGATGSRCPSTSRRLPTSATSSARASGIELYGSELRPRRRRSGRRALCLDAKLFKLRHVQTPEPQVRSALADGSVALPPALFPRTGPRSRR